MLTATTGSQSDRGVQELEKILNLVRDKETFDERVATLRKATADHDASRKALTKAKNLDAALSEAENKNNEATRRLNDAKKSARELVLKAEEESANIRTAAKASRDAFATEANAAEERLAHAKKEIEVIELNASKIMEQAEIKLNRAKSIERENIQLNQQIKERVKVLKQKLAEF